MVDSVPGGGASAHDWEAPALRLTLREVVAGRVRQEVALFNRDLPEVYRGLVAPEESERVLNGYCLNGPRELDPEREVARAMRAFEANAFLVFSKGMQIHSLDEEIDLAAAPELEFIKLLPLAGG
jgi:hypothetical protein